MMFAPFERPDIVEEDGVLAGPIRRPQNAWARAAGSIHNDAVARPLGFRGGTIPGSVHMDQFVPLLLRAFGPRWFEAGGLSCYFRNATVHDEPVRAFLRLPEGEAADVQVEAWMEREDGLRVLDATASVGSPAEPSLLRRTLEQQPPRGETRILAHVRPGTALPPVPTRLSHEDGARRLRTITEPLSWYAGGSPWGGAVAPPSLVIHAMRPVERGADLRRHTAVGLFGALEVRHLHGPVLLERDYEVSGTILAVGETPKTEYVWYESVLRDPGGREVAAMLMMLRFMKASSPLWKES